MISNVINSPVQNSIVGGGEGSSGVVISGVPSPSFLLGYFTSSPDISGKVADARLNLGTDRPRLPGRCIDLNNCSANLGTLDLTGAFTVSMWVKPNDFSFARGYLTSASAFGNGFIIRHSLNGPDGVYQLLGTAINSTGVLVPQGVMDHILVTYNAAESNRLRFYQAGQLMWEGSDNLPGLNGNFWLGRHYTGSTGDLGGAAHSDTRIWQQELTPEQVEQLYLLQEDASLPATYRHYKCDSQHLTLLLDSSGNNAHGTLNGHTAAVGAAFYEGDDVPVDWLNRKGFSDGSGAVKIPRDESDTANDIDGNALDNVGEAPNPAQAVESNCATFSGSEYLTVSSLAGSETVVRSGGTATPTVSAGRIDFTAGTCWDLELSNGMWFPLAEDAGNYHWDVVTNKRAAINGHTEAVYFGQTQDDFHYNLVNGHSRRMNAIQNSSGITPGLGGLILQDVTLESAADPWGTNFALRLKASSTASGTHRAIVTQNSMQVGQFIVAYFKQVANGEAFGLTISSGAGNHSYRFSDGQMLAPAGVLQNIDYGNGWRLAVWPVTNAGTNVLQVYADRVSNYTPASVDDGIDYFIGVVDDWETQEPYPTTDAAIRADRIPAKSATFDVANMQLMHPPGVLHNLAESKLDLNPSNSPYRGDIAPMSDWHPVDNPGSNPTFYRQRTSDGELRHVDRNGVYDRILSGGRLSQALIHFQDKEIV